MWNKPIINLKPKLRS